MSAATLSDLILCYHSVGTSKQVCSAVSMELCSSNQTEIIQIIELLSKSESGILVFNDLINQFGVDVIMQMIRQNLLYYRATKSMSGDLEPV
jgi:hypothetical protein